jgi:hypothetical protein
VCFECGKADGKNVDPGLRSKTTLFYIHIFSPDSTSLLVLALGLSMYLSTRVGN